MFIIKQIARTTWFLAFAISMEAIPLEAQGIIVNNGEKMAFLGDSITAFGCLIQRV